MNEPYDRQHLCDFRSMRQFAAHLFQDSIDQDVRLPRAQTRYVRQHDSLVWVCYTRVDLDTGVANGIDQTSFEVDQELLIRDLRVSPGHRTLKTRLRDLITHQLLMVLDEDDRRYRSTDFTEGVQGILREPGQSEGVSSVER